MNSKSYSLICVCIIVLSFLVRFSLISLGPYHADSLYLAVQSQKIVDTQQMHYLQSSGLPLTALTGAFFVGLMKMFSISDPIFAVNLMSVVFSSLTLIPLMLLARTWFSREVVIAGSILFAINPLFLSLSTFGNSHILSVFYLLWALFALAKYIQTPRIALLILSGLGLGLAGAARLQDLAVLAIPIGIYMLTQIQAIKQLPESTGRRWGILQYFLIPSITALLILLVAYLPKFLGADSIGAGSGESVSKYVSSNLTVYMIGLTWVSFKNICMNLIGMFSLPEIILILAGILALLIQERFKLLVFFMLWILVPITLFGSLIFFVYRFLLVTIPALILLQANGVMLLQKKGKKFFYAVVIILLFGVGINFTQYYPTILFRHQHQLLPDFYRWAGSVTEENAYILERDNGMFIEYYAKRRPLDINKNVDLLDAGELDALKCHFDKLIAADKPLYITSARLMNRTDKFRTFMLENYVLTKVGGRMIEDWHLGVLKHVVVNNDLLRVEIKAN